MALVPQAAPAAINGFEGGDGDQTSSCLATSDWACLAPSVILTAADASGALDDSFVGGSKETQPDAWAYTAEAVQAKADLLAGWTSVTSNEDGRTYLNLAFARAGANGDTYLGIELNQSAATWVNSVGTEIPCRTDGDVLLSYAASNAPNITIHEWDGSGGPAGCPDGRTGTWAAASALQQAFEARMNSAAIVNHLDVPRLGEQLAAETFGEGSIDLSAMAGAINDADAANCSYYRHLSVKTRSSAEVGSSLQDWASGSSLFARACERPDEGGDVTAPGAPSLFSPATACAGTVAVSGTSEPGATVTVYAGGTAAAFAVADAAGEWATTLDLADGTHQLSAEATDAAGNTSARSAAVAVTVDTVAPAAPTLQAAWSGAGMVSVSGSAEPGSEVTILDGDAVVATLTAAADGTFATTLLGVVNADHSYTATAADACRSSAASAPAVVSGLDQTAPAAPTLTAPAFSCTVPVLASGTAEPGSTVALFDGPAEVATTVTDAAGAWAVSLASLAEGEHSLSADATDAAGNRSDRSPAALVAVDTTVPEAPSLTAVRDGDDVQLSGSAEPGSTVVIREGADVVATRVADQDGAFSARLEGVAPEAHTYTATAADACRTSQPTQASVEPKPDTTAPAAPTLTVSGASCEVPVLVSGTAEPGADVAVFEGDDTLATATVDDDGNWQAWVAALTDGVHSLTAQATDAAGNTSARSDAATVDVDLTAPAAPVLRAERVGDDVELAGTAEPLARVDISEGGAVVASVVAGEDGSFSTRLENVSAGGHEYSATASDGCRTSAAADASVGPKPVAPPAPTIAGAASACELPLVVSGTSAPDAQVTLVDRGEEVGSTTANASGDWTLSLASLTDGTHALSAQVPDGAGGTLSSSEHEVVVDTTAPVAPALKAERVDAGTVRLSGSTEPGLSLVVREGDVTVAELRADDAGEFAATVAAAADTEHRYVATSADRCRTSAASDAAVIDADAEPPAAAAEPTPEAPQAPPVDPQTPPVAPQAPAPAPAAGAQTPTVDLGDAATGRTECRNKSFRAYLPVKGVRSATYFVDGQRAAVVRKPDALGQFYAVIDPAKYTPGAHALTARVRFRKRGRKPVTLTLRFRRCDECQSRRAFRIRVPNLKNGERAVRARVVVNGRPVKVVRGKRLRAMVVLRGLPRGTYKVRIITRTNRNRIHRSARTYRTCVPKKHSPPRAKKKKAAKRAP